MLDQWVVVLGVLAVVAGAALFAARQPSAPAEIANVGAQPVAHPVVERATVPRGETRTAAVSAASASPVVATLKPRAEESVPLETLRAVAAPVAAAETPEASGQNANAVTITGCLELDEETYWLKDASGADAPKARTWKSGFLRKRSPRVEVVDETNGLRLPRYVGQRVAATGTLMNREMQAHSLERVAGSCN